VAWRHDGSFDGSIGWLVDRRWVGRLMSRLAGWLIDPIIIGWLIGSGLAVWLTD
jgi:hypothetical protein